MLNRIQRADLPQRARGVGAELDSGAGLFLESGAFEDIRGDPAPGKRDGSRKAADTAAGDENATLLRRHGRSGSLSVAPSDGSWRNNVEQ